MEATNNRRIELLTSQDVNKNSIETLLSMLSLLENTAFYKTYINNSFYLEDGMELYTNEPIEIDKVRILPFCYFKGPIIILNDTIIGPHSYLRPFTIIGKNCKIGHSVEIKSSLICDNVSIAHRAYIGNSIIGKGCMIGVGVSTAVRNDNNREIILRDISANIIKHNTGLLKMGTIMGNKSWIGSHVVTMPGTFIEENSKIRPFNSYGGSCGKKI
jgi:UDP-N-acetylglucosamine diphosphorylase / glucose-1-phosphate thymidylyltransferase / UDP-N-acetylgalactosamine diphosphorylase / glucosamine-1-phosphate N-acetyltransferase / galactosamine-1-phosphate N-acetyltransferase